jgi:hypothetical protein
MRPSLLGLRTFSALIQSTKGDTGANLNTLMGFAHLELLDLSERVIARWHAHEYGPTKLWGVYGNRTAIKSFEDTISVTDVIKQPQPLTIRREATGRILFRYANYDEISTEPLDILADSARPARIRLSFHRGLGGGYFRQISLLKARIR